MTHSTATETTADDTARRVVQRLILPLEVTPDIIPLYIESEAARTGRTDTAAGVGAVAAVRESTADARGAAPVTQVDPDELSERHSVVVPERSMRSFGTYFNAFPASYWRRWTPVRSVRLTVTTAGPGQLIVYRSNARGSIQRHDAVPLGNGSAPETTVLDLPLDAFGDGGWYWFDLYSGHSEVTLIGADWSLEAAAARTEGTVSLAMTTMNKVSYALDNVEQISKDARLREILDVMYVVDQGSDRLSDHPERLDEMQAAMGDQLEVIEQGNIGGSGGFSRGMYEASTNGRSTYVVNLDDDIVIEPESLSRLVAFADYATVPTLVGAHMFDLNNRSVLHAYGEIVNPWRFLWMLPSEEHEYGHDLAAEPLRSTPWLHRRVDVDFHGWWTCLIPTEVVREIGLSLPVFIKWDDSEYGLRAKAAGYPTVSLPGAGVWHISWQDKDDGVGWQSYFHERNRAIAALLHSPYERGGRLIKESQFLDIKHIISMQYSTVANRALALRDLLRGPETLHAEIGTKLPQIKQVLAQHGDSEAKPDVDDYPAVKVTKPPRKGRPFTEPRRELLPIWAAKTLVKQVILEPKESSQEHPQALVAHQDAKWWRLAHLDSALVSNAEGTKVSWYRRSPRQVRGMIAQAVKDHAELLRRWPELRARYRDAAEELTSFAAWEETFAANPAPVRESEQKRSGTGNTTA
ncbi:glycosyltransferase [Brachybacterium sp. Marseille-Q7125]|uniref:glycosyltransferase n=1 Tax=Brachybacterium sp. Marseille-Q7125 TaxID=2932815 RepID=UPI001FF67B04|nr:glycosyltransferase [Brachybacterium sp. Marseille-Q7125]